MCYAQEKEFILSCLFLEKKVNFYHAAHAYFFGRICLEYEYARNLELILITKGLNTDTVVQSEHGTNGF